MAALVVINLTLFFSTPAAITNSIGGVSLLFWMLYVLFKDGFGGQSLGKRLMKIQVHQRQSGEPCPPLRSLVRNVFYTLGMVDWIFLLLNTEKRRLGDLAAGTSVVQK